MDWEQILIFVTAMKSLQKAGEKFFTPRLAVIGLNKGQYGYIYIITETPGITQEKLRKLDILHPSNISRGLEHMEKLGYITREHHETDKRTYRLYPTERALQVVEEIKRIMLEWNSIIQEGLSEEEQNAFSKIVQKMAENADRFSERLL